MSHTRSFLPALFALAFIAGSTADVAAQKTLSADEKELAAYTLTMPTVRKMAAATKAIAQEMARDPKMMELEKLKARMDVLQQKDELTEAEAAEVEKLVERMEALEEEIDKADIADDNATLADMEATLKKHPAAMRALAAEGLAPREYARCMMALLQAAMIEGFSQGKADLTNLPDGVNPANVRFVREHKVELEALQKEMAGIGKKDR
ncbi:MAG: hypothetical protein WD227_11220 [Vicinamibacterales bacterium]